ncbi:MAG: zinc ribbon domain-containing protein, partial [Chloroflexi bacterium]|nr:zinc ribbon domain-containing protein [Chloroflexota bacterium]
MTMIKCPFCGFENLEGALFCENCAFNLHRINTGALNAADPEATVKIELESIPPLQGGGTTLFNANQFLVLRFRDVSEPLKISVKDEHIIGRADASTGQKPDLDLTPYGALDYGVSRRHASFRRGENVIS